MADGLATVAVVLAGTLAAATPLVFASLGELVGEKTGMLNLGVEGMMLVGAVAGFAAAAATGTPFVGFLAAAAAAAALAALFGVLTLYLFANQVATGLSLTIFGIGLSAMVGRGYVGIPLDGLGPVAWPFGLAELPVVGVLVFGHDPMVYLGLAAAVAIAVGFKHTRLGTVLKAVGENPTAAAALGHPVRLIRLGAVLFGGAMSGLGGAYLSLVYSPMWAEEMTAGRGWIALALVVFATWRPGRLVLGAWLFGGATLVQLHLQGHGVAVPAQLLATLPYLATIVVLVVISRDPVVIRLNAPASLGKLYTPER